MRFYHRPPPGKGDKRVRWKFLLFPLTLNYETRWLEFAKIEYNYTRRTADANWGWFPERFIDP